jgi:hypothetical protein
VTRHIAHVNRTVLFIIGLILLAGGGAALVRGLATYPTSLGRSSAPIVTAAQARYPGRHAWVWPAAAASAAIIALLALYWLLIQARTGTVRRLSLEPERTHGVTVLPADAVTGAITDELKTRPGIHRAAAALRGSPAAPGLELSVTAADHTDPALLRGYIEGEALTHLRASLERETIPTVLRIRFGPGQDRTLL